MGKKSRRAAAATAPLPEGAEIPVVGPREPCPCGSGKRYKLCHGRAAAQSLDEHVVRPFEGLAGECDWVALREIVPAATVQVRTTAEHGGVDATVATVLPMAWAALRRGDGEVMVGLQTPSGSGDPSRDVAAALLAAAAAEPGSPIPGTGFPTAGPRLQDVLDPDQPFAVRLHEGFDFWLGDDAEQTDDVRDSMERANAAIIPTERLVSVEAAYWCRIGSKTHLRWVLPHPEETFLDGLARLHAAGESDLGEGTRYIGSFRAHGLIVPVWDLVPGAVADDAEDAAKAFGERLDEAMADTSDLTVEQRRARAGVVSRQLTIR
jgi:hypothetical protein